MNREIWDLPGPRKFIDEVCGDIREGRNVLISLPALAPENLKDQINLTLTKQDICSLDSVMASEDWEGSPAYVLHSIFNQSSKKEEAYTARSLYDGDWFRGRVIWIEGLWKFPELFHEWMKFLLEFSHISGNEKFINRTCFIVPIKGNILLGNLPVENLISQHWYWGKVCSLDLEIFCAGHIADTITEWVEHKLAVRVIAALSGYDFECARVLCRRWLTDCDHLGSVLCELGERRGWNKGKIIQLLNDPKAVSFSQHESLMGKPGIPILRSWSEGIVDVVEGRLVFNSVAMAMNGDENEIARRIWRGHVEGLLPLIDEYRIRVIEYLKFNHRADCRENVDICESTEIGRIKESVDRNPRLRRTVDKDIIKAIRMLTKARNDLAHLKAVDKERRERMFKALRVL